MRKKPRLLEGVYLLDKNHPPRSLVIHNNFSNRTALCCDASFKYLPYQLSMVG